MEQNLARLGFVTSTI